jgi:hypothetical protein
MDTDVIFVCSLCSWRLGGWLVVAWAQEIFASRDDPQISQITQIQKIKSVQSAQSVDKKSRCLRVSVAKLFFAVSLRAIAPSRFCLPLRRDEKSTQSVDQSVRWLNEPLAHSGYLDIYVVNKAARHSRLAANA